MLHKISSLDEINKEVILFDNPDERTANRFSILDIHENIIRIIQTETSSLLKVFMLNKLLSDDWWIADKTFPTDHSTVTASCRLL
jgi:hypothetical protein